MDLEPDVIPFQQQAATQLYLFWYVRPNDLGVLMFLFTVNFSLIESFWLLGWELVGAVIYVLIFRAKRPPGFDLHFFSDLVEPRYLRPGPSSAHSMFRNDDPS